MIALLATISLIAPMGGALVATPCERHAEALAEGFTLAEVAEYEAELEGPKVLVACWNPSMGSYKIEASA